MCIAGGFVVDRTGRPADQHTDGYYGRESGREIQRNQRTMR